MEMELVSVRLALAKPQEIATKVKPKLYSDLKSYVFES